MTSSFAEVPLLYPCQGPTRRRFVIHDEAKSFERAAPLSSNKDVATNASGQRLSGSASASSLGDAVITTCALIDEPTVISVSLLQGTSSPVTVELDLGYTRVFGIPVKIQCFQQGTAFLLRLVDSRGIILSIKLDSMLTPEALTLLSVPRLVEAEQGFFSGAELDASMVTFLSSTVLVLGLAPNLMAVHVVTEVIDIWSQAQIQEEMKSQRLGHIFSRASDLILGRTEDDDIVDMPPTAAICQAGGEYVFSLHSDASIRRWRVHQLHPTEVVPLNLAQDAIPAPETWSDSSGAVALCAQLYTSVYALAIHVQTVGGDEDKSACQLLVLHGTQDLNEGGDLVRSALPLSVPSTATSLVGLNLASERCRLTALYQSQENDMDSTLLVTYPPSVVSIVSSEPIVTPHENTLHGVAAAERSRVTALEFSVNGTSLEEDLHSVDTHFLKYLFRPAFPGATGVVTPPSCIRDAIRKLVPGHYVGEKMSIELETLRAMHEWRRLDNRSVASPAPRRPTAAAVATPGGSVYDIYARQDPDGTPEMNVDDSYMDDEEENVLDQESAAQVESHQQRWRELLLAVWAEEERMLETLCLSNLVSTQSSKFVLVRAGVTSLLKENDPMDDTASKWEDLDRNALILLRRIEKSEEGLAKLNSIQTQIYLEIAKASLALNTNTVGECALELSNVGSKALSESDEDEINPEGLVAALRNASVEDMVDWLQSIDSLFSLDMPGASALPDSADVLDDGPEKTWNNRIADIQTRRAASSLFVQCTDSVRRLTLARFLLLTSLDSEASLFKESLVFQAAFREYLYSISVLWTCAQQVPMPSAVHPGRNSNVDFGNQNIASSPSDSPPTKRLSFGDTTLSILAGGGFGNASVTTSLDAHFIQISQEHSQLLLEAGSLDGSIITMVRICLNSTFAAALSNTLPELGVLPTPSDESVASDYPRLALRLIAPFYADQPLNEDENMWLTRKETLAECLLIEANAEAQKGPNSDSQVNALQSKACDLLAPPSNEASLPIEHKLLETVFVTLQKQSQSMPEEPDLDERDRNEKALAAELQLLLTGMDGHPGTEILRLCNQPTVISLFLPLMASERKSFFRSLEELSRASVKSLTEVLLRISKLMNRLSIFERHTSIGGLLGRGESSSRNDFYVGYIENTIAEFQALLPKSVYESMDEYATLWSLLFNHAVLSRKWKTAHSVCVYHPIPERRVEKYKRLVLDMTNAGAFSELSDLCAMVSCSSETIDSLGACVDLYEIAAETLAGARQGDPYEAGSISADYLGCLYSLHASRGHWARAAEAMDAKYAMALKAVSSSMNSNARLASMMNVNAAANDMVLASLFTSNAVQLIEDPSKRFLVSGEVGPFPSLPILSEEADPIEFVGSSNKRGRNGLEWTAQRQNESTQSKDSGGESRLSRFMTVADLNARAARAIAFSIFLRDENGNATDALLSTIESPTAEGDRACIDRLASLGYYEHAILVAKAIEKQINECTCGAPLGGRSLLHDAILNVVTYLLPVALNPSTHPSNDSMETDSELPRPVFSQLQRAIEETGASESTDFSFVLGETWFPRAELPAVATATAAMGLVRKLTTQYSNSSSPIALEVADMFLDADPSGKSLPLWLERLILGTKAEDSSGLFAHKAGPGFSGDPSSLVGLYMKRGMFPDACDIVSNTLSGNAQTREARAPARLPEKGDVDFIPYEQIDTLWSLIDDALSKPALGACKKRQLEESRETMERALEKHFELMKISEQGMRSARALTQ